MWWHGNNNVVMACVYDLQTRARRLEGENMYY